MAEHARTVVVPLANPDTATDLLRIARALLPTEGGRLIAVSVVLDDADAEKTGELVEGLQELVEVIADRFSGASVEFRSRTATSVARGILDAIRDTGADAVVLGIKAREDDDEESRLGPVVESVIPAAACDVIVYRPVPDHGLDELERILVAVDGELPSRNAVRVATFLRSGLQVDLELLHVHTPDVSDRQAHALMARSMTDLIAEREATVDVHAAADVVEGLTESVRDADLLVVGFRHGEHAEDLARSGVGRKLLDRVDVPVLTVARAAPSRDGFQARLRQMRAWFHPRLTDVEQRSVRSYAESAADPTLDFLSMTVLSGVLATFGLLLDSSAVIIGAMLVAPLMQPIQGFGIAVVAARPAVALRGLGSTLAGAGLVFLVAVVAGLVLGAAEPTDEILARGSPSLLDAAVAVAAGMAGAYATARKGIPAALAGVAIAAALVPPLGAAGLGLAAGRLDLAGGAGLLFTVNIVCIAVVSAVVFQWLGLRPGDHARSQRGQIGLAVATVGALLLLLAGLIVFDARRVRFDERPVADLIAETLADATLVELEVLDRSPMIVRVVVDAVDLSSAEQQDLADSVAAELRRQRGDDVRTRLVVRDVVEAR